MNYDISFDNSGSGDWSVILPSDIDEHDFKALFEPGSVIDGIKSFLAPTVAEPDQPIDYQLVNRAEPPDLIA